MEKLILKKIYEKIELGEKVAMTTLTNSCGSTPGKKGAFMAIFEDGSTYGTVGGGKLEYEIIKKSLEYIEKCENIEFTYKVDDKGELDTECGGEIKGFIKIFVPSNKLIIAGAGHLAMYLHKLSSMMNFHTVVIDEREELVNKEHFCYANELIVGKADEVLKQYNINKNTYIVIVGSNHKNDTLVLESIINSEAGYIGMIGSKGKVSYILKGLIEKGISREQIQKIYAPIGIDIASEKPEEIALGILSEITLIKNNGSLNHMKDIKNIEY